MADSPTDVALSLGLDTTEFANTLAGLGSEILKTIGEINPEVAAVVTAVTAIGIAAVASYQTFEDAEIQLIDQTGKTGEALESLKDSFTQVFLTVPGDAEAAATAIATVSDRLNLQGDAVTNLVTQMAKLSAITGQSTSDIANATTQAFVNWNIATDAQSAALDTLLAVSQTYHVNVVQLSSDLADVGLKAQGAGLTFDQTANLIGTLSAAGINSTQIFQGFNKVMGEMVAAGDVSQITLPGLVEGIQNAGSASDITSAAVTVFGQRAGNQLAQAIITGKVSVDSLTSSLSNTTDTVNKTYDATDSFMRELELTKNNLEAFIAPLGAFITGVGKDFLNWLNTTSLNLTQLTQVFAGGIPGLGLLIGAAADMHAVSTSANTLTTSMQSLNDNALKGVQDSLAGFTASTNTSTGAVTNSLAALQAAQLNAELMTEATKLLDQAQTQHAEDLKSVYQPAIFDVASAQAQVSLAQQEAVQSDQNLQNAEAALQALINSHSKDNNALQTAEENLTLAKAAAKAADDNYSEAEKTLTASKSANTAMTQALQAAQTALTAAIQSEHIPATLSMAQADANVSSALETQQETTQALQSAKDALSQFQNSTGFKDATTEQTLIQNVTGATQDEKAATEAVKQAMQDRSAVSQALQTLDRSIFTDTQTYTSYLKATVIPANTDLDTALQNVITAKQNEVTAGNALQAAIINENAVKADQASTTQDVTNATNAARTAADNLKNSQTELSTATQQLTANFGLSKDQIVLLTNSGTDAASQAQILQAAYSDLGVKSTASITAMATAADKAYQDILQSGTASSGQLLAAQIADLQAQQTADTANGTAMSANQQLTLAKLKQQQSDFSSDYITQWSTMYTSIDKDVQTTASDMINTLVTGQGSFGDEALKMLENIGEAVLNAFIAPAEKAIAQFIAGSITDLLSGLKNIISSATDAGSALSNLPISGASNPGVGGIANSGAGAGSGASGAAGAAGAAASSVASVVTAIASVAGAIGSIGTFIEGFVEQGKEASIELNTRNTATALEATGGVIDFLGHLLPPTVDMSAAFLGWFHDSLASLMDTVEHIGSFATVNADSIGAIKDDADLIHPDLMAISNTLSAVGESITNSLAILNQTAIQGLTNVAIDIQNAAPNFNVTNTVTISATALANAIQTVIQKGG